MKRYFRNNGLSLVLFTLFLLFWFGQSWSGYLVEQDNRQDYGRPAEAYSDYLLSGHFWQATFENWESEFLQMAAYILLTVYLFQRGSAESKDPDKKEEEDLPEPPPEDADKAPAWFKKGGWRRAVYKYSLTLALLLLFAGSFVGHAIGGLEEHNEELRFKGKPEQSLGEFWTGSEFWFQSFQNWQSEFLAVLAIVVLSIWLRQHGSPESKPVWKAHDDTGSS